MLVLSKAQTPLTRPSLGLCFQFMLRAAGLGNTSYNTHSFQIGVVTTTKTVIIADACIQLLGQWRRNYCV